MMNDEPRDLTNEELNALTLSQRKDLAKKYLKLKREYFHPNMMMMNGNFLQSEFRDLNSKNEEAAQYMMKMINICGPIRN
jgi:ribosomal protein L29